MNKLIELNSENNLVIQPEALVIDAYAVVWNRDKSKDKKLAIKELTFVYFMCSLDRLNVYKEYVPEERLKMIKEDMMPKDWKVDKIIKDAIEQYKKHNYSATTELVIAAQKAADNLKKFFEEIDLNERDTDTGKPIHKATDLMRNLKEMAGVRKGLQELLQMEEEEKTDKGKVRGGGRIGLFENHKMDKQINI